jgi:hypothetical protein
LTISTVAAGQTIDPDWGNSIANAINTMESAWTSYTPTLTAITAGTGSTLTARYKLVGKTLTVACTLILGTGGALTGTALISLPTGLTARNSGSLSYKGALYITDAGTGWHNGTAVVTAGASAVQFFTSGIVNATTPMTWTASDVLDFQIVVEVA